MAPAVILVAPQMGENIGAAARVMANFDLKELRLVAPRDGWPNEKADAMAAGAVDILRRAKLFDDVASATADLRRVFATTARPREMIKPVRSPREAAAEIAAAEIAAEGQSGILFGPERSGLNNDDVVLADTVISIPVGAFTSLNLAQAVGVVAYECFLATTSEEAPESAEMPATKADLQALFTHLENELDKRHFFFPEEKRPSMVRNLRNLLQRKGLLEAEVRILHGVIKALTRAPMDE